MRNCYDLATAQKNERENQQVQDTPVNENLVLSGNSSSALIVFMPMST